MNGKGKPEEALLDVERTSRLVPVLIEDCTKEPKSSYWQEMKQEFKRIFEDDHDVRRPDAHSNN